MRCARPHRNAHRTHRWLACGRVQVDDHVLRRGARASASDGPAKPPKRENGSTSVWRWPTKPACTSMTRSFYVSGPTHPTISRTGGATAYAPRSSWPGGSTRPSSNYVLQQMISSCVANRHVKNCVTASGAFPGKQHVAGLVACAGVARLSRKCGRVAILGGGMAGLATAWRLSAPGWRDHFESITVYQRGWRLGGKAASSRGPHGRIEEHGLHVWLGSYENAFTLLRECYAELDRPGTDPDAPVQTWDQALIPADHLRAGGAVGCRLAGLAGHVQPQR